jgi:hypothetical protein
MFYISLSAVLTEVMHEPDEELIPKRRVNRLRVPDRASSQRYAAWQAEELVPLVPLRLGEPELAQERAQAPVEEEPGQLRSWSLPFAPLRRSSPQPSAARTEPLQSPEHSAPARGV